MQNKANLPPEDVGRGRPAHEEPTAPNKAKLGQDGISAGHLWEPYSAERTQFPASRAAEAWPIVSNKANFRQRERPRTRLYKQTQSGTPRGEEGYGCGQTNPIWGRGRLCETKPISGGTEGADRTKQSQFSPRCRAGHGLGDAGWTPLYKQTQSGVPSRGQGCRREQTKPICPLEGVGRGRPTHEEPRANRTRQSQFPLIGPARVARRAWRFVTAGPWYGTNNS
jgi:hypothetical protein